MKHDAMLQANQKISGNTNSKDSQNNPLLVSTKNNIFNSNSWAKDEPGYRRPESGVKQQQQSSYKKEPQLDFNVKGHNNHFTNYDWAVVRNSMQR